MKVTIERDALHAALARAAGAVRGGKETIPILSHFLLEAADGRLAVTATDIERTIKTSIEAQVEASGAITAPAEIVRAMVGRLPSGTIVLERGDREKLTLRAGRFSAVLNALPASDFPPIEVGASAVEVAVPGADLARLLTTTGFAVCTDQTRYNIGGLRLQAVGDGKVLRAIATDGSRMAIAEVPLEAPAPHLAVTVPRDGLKLLIALAGEAERVEISASPRMLSARAGETTFTTKLIDAEYPEYERVVPGLAGHAVRLPLAEVAAAIDRVSTVMVGHGSRISFKLQAGSVVVEARNGEGGTGYEEVEAEYRGDGIAAGFNYKLLSSILEHAGQEEGEFDFSIEDPSKPALIKPADRSGTFVLMPMRL